MKGVFIWPNQRTWSMREKGGWWRGGGLTREEKCPAWPLWNMEMSLIHFNETLHAHLCANDETQWERRWGGERGRSGRDRSEDGAKALNWRSDERGNKQGEFRAALLHTWLSVSKTDKQPRGQSSLSPYHIWTGWAISSARLRLKCVRLERRATICETTTEE